MGQPKEQMNHGGKEWTMEKAQIWMKKIEQLHMGEIDQCKDDGFQVDNQP